MYFTVLFTTCHCAFRNALVPLYTNNSKLPELSFYRLPLHGKKLLLRWLVNVRRVNTNVNKHSRVCSAHFEGGRKQGKDAVPIISAWTKEPSATRAPSKECSTPVGVTTSHSIGITTFMPPENHVSTCTKDLIICTTVDKEIMVKPTIVSAGYNTEICTYCDIGTNTERMVS